jgi:hypothetical protein
MELAFSPCSAALARGAIRLLILGVLVGLLHACNQDSPVRPATTPRVRSISITIIGSAAPLAAGGTYSISAWADLSDGTHQDCTSQATWTSSNTSVAAVTSPGVLAGLAPGTADIVASCSGVVALRTVVVYAGGTLSGTVRAEDGAPVAGAFVELTYVYPAMTTTSDAAGGYTFPVLARGFTYSVYVRKAGYEQMSVRVDLNQADTMQDITLRPAS